MGTGFILVARYPACLGQSLLAREPGKALTADQLNKKLIEFGVPAESIKKSGKHTLLELGNKSFV